MKKKLEWNLKLLYRSDTDPQIEKDRKAAKRACLSFARKWRKNQGYLKDPKVLLRALKEYEDLATNHGTANKEAYYLHLRSSQEADNTKLQAMINLHDQFSVEVGNELEFFTQNIAKIPKKEQKKFLRYSPLKNYWHFLKRGFDHAKYLRTEAEEKVLNIMGKTSLGNWVDMVEEFISKETRESLDEDGKKKEKTFEELMSLISSPKKKVREMAAKNVNNILAKHLPVATKELNTVLEHHRNIMKLRGYKRPDQSRHLSDEVDSKVVDALVKAVSGSYKVSNRYYKLMTKLLRVKKLHYFERSLPYGQVQKKYSFNQAKKLVLEVYNSIDPELAELAEGFFDEGRIDVLPRKGKRGGAFASYFTLSLPTYIMLNHTDKLNDVTTLAHELGHGVNYELIRQNQTEINFSTPTSTAEVASTFFEDFVFEKVITQEKKDEEKLKLLLKKLSADIATIYRQISLYRFEQEIHAVFAKEGYVSSETFGKIFNKHMSAYLGPSVEMEDGSENWWVYWHHIRMFFYVYSYASGLLISKSLQAMVRRDPEKIAMVKKFLSAGRSDSPKNLFRKMNIDIADPKFWKLGIKEMEKDLAAAEKLAKKLGKI